MFKKIFCFILTLIVFALPLTVSAEGEEPQPTECVVNISATVDGEAPLSGEFIVNVKKEIFDDENDVYLEPVEIDSFKLNAENEYTKKHNLSILIGERFSFTVSSEEASIFVDDHVYYAVVYPEDGLVISYENADGSEDVELSEGQTEYNLVFANKSAPKLIEVTVKGVDGKKITKEYDGTTDAIVPADCLELVGVGEGADVKLEYDTAKFNNANVKKASAVVVSGFKLVGRDAAGFIVVTDKVQLEGEITPRTITVKADNKVMTFGDFEPKLTYKVTGELVGDDEFVGELARTPGNNVGTYVITLGTLTLSGNSENYNVVFEEGKFTISNYSESSVTDSESSVSIKGYFDASSSVTVSPISATDSDYKSLFDNAAWGKVVSAYNIKLGADGFDGDITVTFPVPNEYNGKEIAIYQLMSNGAVTCFKTVASDTVSLTTTECTQFMLVVDKDGVESEEKDEKRSPVATVFIVLLIILGVIVGLILLIVLLFFGMVFFNKTEELKAIIRGVKKLFRK